MLFFIQLFPKDSDLQQIGKQGFIFFLISPGNGGGQKHRFLIFFSPSSAISNSFSAEQIKIKLNLSS